MFTKLLIANRGVISCRITRTLRRLGVASVAVYSAADAQSLQVCAANEAVLLGPAPTQMRAFGLKHTARAIAEEHGVPLLPGTGLLADAAAAAHAAERIGYPVMLKSTAGGGGIGMRVCWSSAELTEAFA